MSELHEIKKPNLIGFLVNLLIFSVIKKVKWS